MQEEFTKKFEKVQETCFGEFIISECYRKGQTDLSEDGFMELPCVCCRYLYI